MHSTQASSGQRNKRLAVSLKFVTGAGGGYSLDHDVRQPYVLLVS